MPTPRTVEGELRKALFLAARIRERLDYVLRCESREQAKVPPELREFKPLPEGMDENIKSYAALMTIVVKGHVMFRGKEEMTPEEVAIAEELVRKQVLREASPDALKAALEAMS